MENFVVFADKRTGSSFFMECLNSHPDINCWDEMFMIRGGIKKRRGQFLYKYMKGKNKKYTIKNYLDFLYSDEEKSNGFRLMYPQQEYFKVLPHIKKENVKIIHLMRKNTLKMVISKKTKKVFKPKKEFYKPDIMISDIKHHENKKEKAIKDIGNYKNVTTIYYEDMIGRYEGNKGEVEKFGAFNLISDMITYLNEDISKQICNFIGVEEKELFCNVTKKNSNNVWDYIKNDKKIKKVLENNGYGYMI